MEPLPKPAHLQPELSSKRSQHSEKSMLRNEKATPLPATTESPSTAMKTTTVKKLSKKILQKKMLSYSLQETALIFSKSFFYDIEELLVYLLIKMSILS